MKNVLLQVKSYKNVMLQNQMETLLQIEVEMFKIGISQDLVSKFEN
jgi:hypothetical protein